MCFFFNYSVLLIFLFISIRGYIIICIGWSANSIYSIIGSIRSVSQILSYEVSFILIILVLIILKIYIICYLVFRVCSGVLGLTLLVLVDLI
ncbi:hypothetical protein ACFW04_012097 [Cataglyphis niger]